MQKPVADCAAGFFSVRTLLQKCLNLEALLELEL
jgi:hypothetical protein